MIITIDGPAGSGKSSTARAVARELGFLHLDSGALYRAFAHAACRRGDIAPEEIDREVARSAAGADVEARATADGVEVRLDGRPLDRELRSPEVTACASRISQFAEIRGRVNELLRGLARAHPGSIVCEGRDMGTVVFPEADLKIYMTAAIEERARRRLSERGETPTAERVERESRTLEARDRSDSKRAISPLRKAEDAVAINTTDLPFEEQVERIVELARIHLDTPGGSG